MKFEKLENIADVIAGQSPPSSTYNKEGNGIPFFQGKADYGKKYPIVRNWCTSPTKISKPDDILISVRAPVGPVNINNVESCIGRGLSAIRVKENYSMPYVFSFLKANEIKIANLGVGSTFTAITQKDLRNLIIPTPDYKTQLYIAHILSKIEDLITQRKESIFLLDEYLKSVFWEMFGNNTDNDKDWNKISLIDGCVNKKDVKCGPFGTQLNKSEYQENGIPVWGIPQINSEFKILPKEFLTDRKAFELDDYSVIPYDIVMSRKGNVGKCSLFPKGFPKGIIHSDVLRIRTDEKKVHPVFLLFQLKYSKKIEVQIKGVTKGAIMSGINVGLLKHIIIDKPPLELQIQFAQIVEKTEAIKAQYEQSLQELESLYGSLSQKAFRGELVFDKEQTHAAIKKSNRVVKFGAKELSAISDNKKGFAKQVLGGKIVSLFREDQNFTRIKFQKLQYLAEHIAEEDLDWNYYRQAAGPYDNKFMHVITRKLKQNKWFEEKSYKFYPLPKANDIDRYYQNYFGNKNDKLDELFSLLKNATEKFCEAIATIYAVWNNHIILQIAYDESRLKKEFFEWSNRKEMVFTEDEFEKALAWMQKHNITPTGFGYLIKERSKKKKR
nr:restriction endonuclease subunit S [uncultured Draconibacterium sp.]